MDPLDIFKNHLLISGLFFREVYFSLPMNVYGVVVNKGFECKCIQRPSGPFYFNIPKNFFDILMWELKI